MSPNCKLCKKEMCLDTEMDTITSDLFDLYYCHLCQSPTFDSMYKEVYKNIYDGSLKIKELVVSAVLVDKYYVIWGGGKLVPLDHGKDQTIIFKDITGTVAHSIFMYPITQYNPIAMLPFLLELPLDDLPAALKKLQTITTFS